MAIYLYSNIKNWPTYPKSNNVHKKQVDTVIIIVKTVLSLSYGWKNFEINIFNKKLRDLIGSNKIEMNKNE